MKKFFAVFGVALLLTLFSGCGSTKPGLLGLKAELLTIELDGQGGAVASWQVANPNVVSYIVSESRHKIYVGGRYVGTAITKKATGVPPRANIPQAEPIALEKDAAGFLATAGGTASYRVDSDLTIQLYGEIFEHHHSTAAGTVQVVRK